MEDGKEQLRKSCDYCAQMKRACDGGEPCALCCRRGKNCERSVRRKSGPAKGAKYAPRRSKEQKDVAKVEKDIAATIVAVTTAAAGKSKAVRGREQAPKKRPGGRLGSHRASSASGASGNRASGSGARGIRDGSSGVGGAKGSGKGASGGGGESRGGGDGGGGRGGGVSGRSITIHISSGGSSMVGSLEGAAEEQAEEGQKIEQEQRRVSFGRPSLAPPPPAAAPPPPSPAPPARDGHHPHHHSKARGRNGRRRTCPPAPAPPSTTTITTTMTKTKTSPSRAPYSTTTAAVTSRQVPSQRRGGSSSSSSLVVGSGDGGGAGGGDSRGGGPGAGAKRALEESEPPALLARQLDVNVSVSVGVSVSVDVSAARREGEGRAYEKASASKVGGGSTSCGSGGSSSSSSKKIGKEKGSGSDAGGGGGGGGVVHLASSPSHGPPRKRRFPSAGAPTPQATLSAPSRGDCDRGSGDDSRSGVKGWPADDKKCGSGRGGGGGGGGGIGDIDRNPGGGERRSSDVVSSFSSSSPSFSSPSSSSSSSPSSSPTSSPSLSSSSTFPAELPTRPPLKVEQEEQGQEKAVKVVSVEAADSHPRFHLKQEERYGASEESPQGNKRRRVHHRHYKREAKEEEAEEGEEEKEKAREQYRVVFHHRAEMWRSDERAADASATAAAAAVTTLRGRASARVASEVSSRASVTAETTTVAEVVAVAELAATKAADSETNRTPYNAVRAVVQTRTGRGGSESVNMACANEPTRSGWGEREGGDGGGSGWEVRWSTGATGNDGDSWSAGGRRRGSSRSLREEEIEREEVAPRVQAWEPPVGSGGIGPHYHAQGAPGHQGWGKQRHEQPPSGPQQGPMMAPAELLLKLRPHDVTGIIDIIGGGKTEHAPPQTPAGALGRPGAPGGGTGRPAYSDRGDALREARGGGGGRDGALDAAARRSGTAVSRGNIGDGGGGGGGGGGHGRDAPHPPPDSEAQARREERTWGSQGGVAAATDQRRGWRGADSATSATERQELPPLYAGATGNRARHGRHSDDRETAAGFARGGAREGSGFRSGPDGGGGDGGGGPDVGPRDFVEGCLGTDRVLPKAQGCGERHTYGGDGGGAGGTGGGDGRGGGSWRAVETRGDNAPSNSYHYRSRTGSVVGGGRGRSDSSVFATAGRFDSHCGGGDGRGGDGEGGFGETGGTTHDHDATAKWRCEDGRTFIPSLPALVRANLRLRPPFPGPEQQRLGHGFQSHQPYPTPDGPLRTAAAGTRTFNRAEEEEVRRGHNLPSGRGEWSQSQSLRRVVPETTKVMSVDKADVPVVQLSGGGGGGGGGGGDQGRGGEGWTRYGSPVWKGNTWSLSKLAPDRSRVGASRDGSGGGTWDADRGRQSFGGGGLGGGGGGLGSWGRR